MSITAGEDTLASDFIATSGGASDEGKVPKLNDKGMVHYSFLSPIFFGDGSDGDVVISGNTTLIRDMYYDDLTIDNGITLSPDGYKIFVRGTLTNNGVIARNGNDGGDGANRVAGTGGGAAGLALPARTLGGSPAGGKGANGVSSGNGLDGNPGGATTKSIGVVAAVGGNSYPVTGGEGGDAGAYIQPTSRPKTILEITNMRDGEDWELYQSSPGSGGGASGEEIDDDASGAGGGGASAGGIIAIFANIIINTGVIQTNGGDGGDGGDGGLLNPDRAGAGAGGGAGSGGVIIFVYSSLTNTGTIETAVGIPGVAGEGYRSAGPGGEGTTGPIIYHDVTAA